MDGELRSIFRKHLPRVAWTTIETGGVEPGVPDSNGLYDGIEFWIEMKRTEAWSVEVKPSQVAWHTLRQSKRGRTFFAVRRRSTAGGSAVDELYLISGRYAAHLKSKGLRECPTIVKTSGGPAKWGWAAVLHALLNRELQVEGGRL
jgi:hypothetical protein